MCPPRFDLLRELTDMSPEAIFSVGAGVAVMTGLALVLRALRRRHRELAPAWEALDEGRVSRTAPSDPTGMAVAAGALALAIPLVTAMLVVTTRDELRTCIALTLTRDADACPGWRFLAIDGLADVARGAMIWLATLPLAAAALGWATGLCWRASYLRRVADLDATTSAAARAIDERDGYRRVSERRRRDSRERLLVHRPPSLAVAWAIWGVFATAAVSFATGVVRFVWATLDELRGALYPMSTSSPTLEEALHASAGILDHHMVVAAVAVAIGLALWASTVRSSVASRLPPASTASIVGRVVLAVACLAAARPYAKENAHPVPVDARSWIGGTQHALDIPFDLPRLDGDVDILDGPEIRIGPRVTVDGQRIVDPAELEDVMRRKRELWLSFHPGLPFPGFVNVAAERGASPERLARWLAAVQRSGFERAVLLVDRPIPFEHPPLGLWPARHRVTGVTIELRCARGQIDGEDVAGEDVEAPDVEALARVALETSRRAPLCLSDG